MSANEMYTAVELLLKSADAEEVMRKGVAEVAFRRADQKFRSLVKCRIANNSQGEAAEKLLNSALGFESSNAANKIRSALKDIDLANKKLPAIENGIKSLTSKTESLISLSNKVRSLSFINAGLSLANLAVNITGFVIIGERLKSLSKVIDQLKPELESIKGLILESDVYQKSEKIIMEYNSITDKVRTGESIDRDSLEDFLITAKTFLSSMIRLLDDDRIDSEALLNIILTLLPAYTSILCIFLKAYYFEKRSTPGNYDKFLEVYQEINTDRFRNTVQDYYYIKQHFSYRDVIDILNTQLVFIFSDRLQIEDQMALLDTFNTEEAYLAFEKKLDELAEEALTKEIDSIAKDSGIELSECRRVLTAQA